MMSMMMMIYIYCFKLVCIVMYFVYLKYIAVTPDVM